MLRERFTAYSGTPVTSGGGWGKVVGGVTWSDTSGGGGVGHLGTTGVTRQE